MLRYISRYYVQIQYYFVSQLSNALEIQFKSGVFHYSNFDVKIRVKLKYLHISLFKTMFGSMS